MAREQHLGQGERLDTEEVNIGNKTMQQEVSLSIDMVTIMVLSIDCKHFLSFSHYLEKKIYYLILF